ncbi:hypothetical protein CTAYLR_002746 [Chrysophaeum taylorii]|uniref:Lipoyl synthase, mitochondrial n=1 Tax=Chrysophaeum taylorii TaxID=2483200 RepID=A0AAD7UBQ0_9STRA|nr:hypothetical protein CTAYLR_002746 [Chrysophaeum taylorii]
MLCRRRSHRGVRQLSTRLEELKATLRAEGSSSARPRKPSWLKVNAAGGPNYERLRSTVRDLGLATVCEEARCPNIGECWEGGDSSVATATIMIMGDECTRGCRFCSVKTSRAPKALDPEEPRRVAEAVSKWGLDYVVLTSVDRDDVPDQGASHVAATVRELKNASEDILVEVLAPDFRGEPDLVSTVASSGLDVFAHNLETVERLTPRVRDRRAAYSQSLRVLETAKSLAKLTKTSLMLGLGEADHEVRAALHDCRAAGVDVVTFGQYLRPTKRHLAVADFVTPAKFEAWQHEAEAMGFAYVASGPLVRSSYKAGELFVSNMLRAGGVKHEDTPPKRGPEDIEETAKLASYPRDGRGNGVAVAVLFYNASHTSALASFEALAAALPDCEFLLAPHDGEGEAGRAAFERSPTDAVLPFVELLFGGERVDVVAPADAAAALSTLGFKPGDRPQKSPSDQLWDLSRPSRRATRRKTPPPVRRTTQRFIPSPPRDEGMFSGFGQQQQQPRQQQQQQQPPPPPAFQGFKRALDKFGKDVERSSKAFGRKVEEAATTASQEAEKIGAQVTGGETSRDKLARMYEISTSDEDDLPPEETFKQTQKKKQQPSPAEPDWLKTIKYRPPPDGES